MKKVTQNRWLQKGIFYMTLAAAVNAESAEDVSTKLNAILRKPLIVGASVSGDHRAQSPGKLLALQYTTKDNIKSITRNGSSSAKILESFKEKDATNRSIIIALDLFFWDSTLNSAASSIRELNRITDIAIKNDIPIVIGEIPELIPGWQPQRERLNKEIRSRCNDKNKCYLISFDDLLKQALTTGYVVSNGKKFVLAELLPDGLHLSTAGSELISARLKTLLESKI